MLEIKEEKNQTYRFVLRSVDGLLLFESVPFKSKQQINSAIAKMTPAISDLLVFERKTDYEGKFLFHLKNADRVLIGKSGIFESEAGMENGIKHLKKRLTDLAPDFSDL